MATLLIQNFNAINGGTRILMLVLLLLAVVLIIAGAAIALFTFYYARKQNEPLNTRKT